MFHRRLVRTTAFLCTAALFLGLGTAQAANYSLAGGGAQLHIGGGLALPIQAAATVTGGAFPPLLIGVNLGVTVVGPPRRPRSRRSPSRRVPFRRQPPRRRSVWRLPTRPSTPWRPTSLTRGPQRRPYSRPVLARGSRRRPSVPAAVAPSGTRTPRRRSSVGPPGSPSLAWRVVPRQAGAEVGAPGGRFRPRAARVARKAPRRRRWRR